MNTEGIKNLEELLAKKENLRSQIEERKSKMKSMNSYFSENKIGILWAQINPFSEKTNSNFSFYYSLLENAVLPFIGGEQTKNNIKQSAGKIASVLLSKLVIKLLKKIFPTQSENNSEINKEILSS